ncbi:MAG: PilC/PilY family type IV pilus protein [Thermodesulfobacteriota bacterium]
MRFSKIYLKIFLLYCVLFIPILSFAMDTDLYIASGEGVEPNILIIFDNSGSMNENVPAPPYDPNTLYDPLVVPQSDAGKVYYRQYWGGWILFANSISEVLCSKARAALTNYGHYEGYTSSNCKKNYYTLRTGNYRNYLAWIANDPLYSKPKLQVAKEVIEEFLNTINGVRIGVMIFNYSEGGRIQSVIRSLDEQTRNQLIQDIKAIVANTWTPLAETLYEAGLYFKGGSSYFNSGVYYTSPIQYYCQRNYIVIITDGMSTQDRNSILASAIGDRDGDRREPIGAPNDPNYPANGSDYLDDVAKYLYDSDLRSDLTGKQNIITYTIGFTENNDLLERTATHGHGRYYYAKNAQELSDAFQNIIGEILEKTSSFVAPIVPVSRMERTSSGDKIYLALFQPKQNKMWSGNIKKYGIAQSGKDVGKLLDVEGKDALDDRGLILETARSYWSTSMDGSDVEKGGVGEVLMNRDFSANPRKIYTYLGTDSDLTHSSNAFNETNITPGMLGLGNDTNARDKLVRFIYGYDAYDDEPPFGRTDEKRSWILGSFLHSRPLVIHYNSRSVIYAGANDGMLHAFDDETGEELWAFIPPNLLNKLQALHADVLEFFVDGSPKAFKDPDSNRIIMIFGQRRGGNRYYALDITDPIRPRYIWEINPDAPGSPFSEMGQSWSTPNIAKIAYGSGEKWVFFIGGGYDINQDNEPPGTDSKGRAVYVVDVLNGSLIKRFSYAEYSNMTYCIPSDVARVDVDRDRKIDRLYVGDMGGRIWRFDINDPDPDRWTGRIIFQSNPGADGTTGRKIFYPPDVTLEKSAMGIYEMLFFGTGDREHPKDGTVINRIYAIKDRSLPGVLKEMDLIDVTSDELQNPETSQTRKNEIYSQLRSANGWFIKLDINIGEKILAPSVVLSKVVYFTSFSPTTEMVSGDPCYIGEGTGRLYALEYLTGNAAFNFDITNDVNGEVIKREDRSKVIGTAIPSGVIVTVIKGKVVSYIGVGGGANIIKSSEGALKIINWRIIF